MRGWAKGIGEGYANLKQFTVFNYDFQLSCDCSETTQKTNLQSALAKNSSFSFSRSSLWGSADIAVPRGGMGAHSLLQLLDHHPLLVAAESLSHCRMRWHAATGDQGQDVAHGAAGFSADCRPLSQTSSDDVTSHNSNIGSNNSSSSRSSNSSSNGCKGRCRSRGNSRRNWHKRTQPVKVQVRVGLQ